MSESHQRQLLLFAENPDEYLDSFSQDFQDGYLELLRRQYGTRRIHCNVVYNEYIQDKEHIHMNSTKWQTLTEFVMWLGKEGKVTVEPTEKGIFITWIDRDPETLARQEAILKKERMEATEAELEAKRLQQQIERGKVSEKDVPEAVYTELQRDDESEKVAFSLAAGPSMSASGSIPSASAAEGGRKLNPLELAAAEARLAKKKQEKEMSSRKRKSALEEIMAEEEKRKKAKTAEPPPANTWLRKNIVVKILDKKNRDFYKQKGTVVGVTQKTARISVNGGDKPAYVDVHENQLETVIPAVGRDVLVLSGKHRGCTATLKSIEVDKFMVKALLMDGPARGRTVELDYECVSKLVSGHSK